MIYELAVIVFLIVLQVRKHCLALIGSLVLIYSLDTTRQPRPGEINGKGERILIDKHGYSCKNKSKGSL